MYALLADAEQFGDLNEADRVTTHTISIEKT